MLVAARRRRPLVPGYSPGDYIPPLGVTGFSNRTPSTSANVTAMMFALPRRVALDRIFLYLVTAQAGAAARVGLYADTGLGRPGALLVDGGELDLSTGSGTDVPAIIAASLSGLVWGLVWLKNVATQVTVQGLMTIPAVGPQASNFLSGPNGRSYLTLTAAYPSAMPATAPPVLPSTSSSVPVLMLRAA